MILVGGHGRRLGQPKASAQLAGRSLLERALDNLRPLDPHPILLARDRAQELPLSEAGLDVVLDEDPGAGPLPALANGLRTLAARGDDTAVVVACDLPFVDAELLLALVRILDQATDPAPLLGVVPSSGGRPQPLCAAYRTGLAEDIEVWIDAGERRAMRLARHPLVRTLTDRETRAIDPEGRFAFDIDTPEDLWAAEAKLRGTSPER